MRDRAGGAPVPRRDSRRVQIRARWWRHQRPGRASWDTTDRAPDLQARQFALRWALTRPRSWPLIGSPSLLGGLSCPNPAT